MKLVKITHWRCGEVDGCTFLAAPDGITEEQLGRDTETAETQYIEAIKAFEEANKPPPIEPKATSLTP